MAHLFLNLTLCLILTVFGASLTIVSPLLTTIAEFYGVSIVEAGALLSLSFAGFGTFIFCSGYLSYRLNSNRLMVIALLLFSVSLGAFIYAPTFALAAFCMFVVGGAGGIIDTMVIALLAELNPKKSAMWINMSQGFLGLGAVGGPLLVFFLGATHWQLNYSFVFWASIGASVLYFLCKRPVYSRVESFDFGAIKKVVRDPIIIKTSIALFMYMGAEIAVWGWLATFLTVELNVSADGSSMAIALFWGMSTVGRFASAALMTRFKARSLAIILAACSTVTTGMLIGVTSDVLIWGVIALLGLSVSGLWALIVSVGNELKGGANPMEFSFIIGVGGIGGTVIPFMMGFIADSIQFKVALILPVILFALLIILFTQMKPQEAE